MNILLFGANGQVGRECQKLFQVIGWNVTSLTRKDVDFSKPGSVYDAVKANNPDIVVNACAYTAVDKAESESALANLINADAVGLMGKACRELEIPTIHISTDYVFDGKAEAPYKEEDLVSPMGVYGQSKFAGEQQLQRDNPKHIIFRTSWVFSAHGNNFVKTMLRLSAEHEKLSVVGDQIGCPTYAGDLAQSIASVIIQIQKNSRFSNWGLYHCSNRGACSWYDFALAIFDAGVQSGLLSKIPSVNSITTAEYKAPTARPAYSVLDDAKLKVLLGQSMPHWNNGLKAVCLALR